MSLLRLLRIRNQSSSKAATRTVKNADSSGTGAREQTTNTFITIEDICKANADFIEERSKGLRPAIRYVFSESEINNAWRATHTKP